MVMVSGMCIGTAAAVAQPTIIDLGITPTASGDAVTDISADGSTVIGTQSALGLPLSRVWRWTEADGASLLPVPVSIVFGTTPAGLSLDGRSVCLQGGGLPPMIWNDVSGIFSLEDVLGDPFASISDMCGNASCFTGFSTLSGDRRAVRWTLDGGAQNLDPAANTGSGSSHPFAISGDGTTVVGRADRTRSFAFRWTESGGFAELPSLPGATYAEAHGVSFSGSVVCGTVGTSSGPRAFRWTAETGMQNLGVPPDRSRTEGLLISGDGRMIAGSAGSGSMTTAFVWTKWTGTVDLAVYCQHAGLDLDEWVLGKVGAISADGSAIAGEGTRNGSRAFFLIRDLPVGCAADFDNSGVLTIQDVFGYMGAWFNGDLQADFDRDGDLSTGDVFGFLGAWFAGC